MDCDPIDHTLTKLHEQLEKIELAEAINHKPKQGNQSNGQMLTNDTHNGKHKN
jgi:hypothetical protein